MAARTKRSRGRRVAMRVLRIVAMVVLIVLLLPYALAIGYRFVNPTSTLMLWRMASRAPAERTWLPLNELSPALPLAAIVAEDGRFCFHHGVDLREIWSAVTEADELRDARGGSTITQQTAKNLFLWNSRSFVRKALELPLALWLELVLGKRRILEIYLNIVEWGPDGEFGAEAGALRAFGKSASDLDASEAALLVSILPNPHARDARSPGPALRRIAGVHLRRMVRSPNLAECAEKPRKAAFSGP